MSWAKGIATNIAQDFLVQAKKVSPTHRQSNEQNILYTEVFMAEDAKAAEFYSWGVF
jgi:hypothetical protein